ncbi:MAG: glycine--tRNA ligase subunit alpha [Rickettsiaceae bacterium]
MEKLSFQQIILNLQNYWQNYGCAILQPYDVEMGAGTFHPATVLKSLGPKPWNVVYVQPSRRPTDSRYAMHPNRMQHYYQLQVLLKPSPDNIQKLYIKSLESIGIDTKQNDIRFVEDNWESPTLGAVGLGWEIWCNGMEISQFTYMQKMGSINCKPTPGEITYGLERIALCVQNVDSVKDIIWNNPPAKLGKALTYEEIDFAAEREFSRFNLELADTELLFQHFMQLEQQAQKLIEDGLPIVAYEHCIKASHIFNLIDARRVISTTQRASYIARVRNIAKACCAKFMELNN